MQSLPREIILWDTEYTAWEGSQARKWNGPNEYRELVQIGAIIWDSEAHKELGAFSILIKPVRNPVLSRYFTDLTRITEDDIESSGVSFADAAQKFRTFVQSLPCYAYGGDRTVLLENYELYRLQDDFVDIPFFDVREVFKAAGIDADAYMSSTIPQAFGKQNPGHGHNALDDARSIAVALTALVQGVPVLENAKLSR